LSFNIRVMTHNDIDFAMRLIDSVRWGNTRADIERSLFYEPHGCFVASIDGVDVGIVNSFLYDDVGFIGNLIVEEGVRGRGVGAALMSHAITRLTSEGATRIRLDAVQEAVPLYKRLGFMKEYWSLRFSGIATHGTSHGVRPMTEEDLGDVNGLDLFYSGFDRGQKLRRVFGDSPDLCFVAELGGEMKGFIMGKLGASAVRFGPWVCDPHYDLLASSLFNGLMSRVIGQRIWVGVPEYNMTSVNIIQGNCLEPLPSSLRMCFGGLWGFEKIEGLFAIGAADKG